MIKQRRTGFKQIGQPVLNGPIFLSTGTRAKGDIGGAN